MSRSRLSFVALGLATALAVSAQPNVRRVTNLAALMAYPAFFHLRPVIVAGNLERQENGQLRLLDEAGSMRVVFKGSASDGLNEIRGEYWDLGRMNADDPRLASYDLRATFQVDPEGPWPRPGQVTALMAAAITPTTPPVTPSIRAVALHPARYLDQPVTVTGQFSGRNLLGDLPDGPANSPYDFVLRSADAAVWVSFIRARGRDFDLAVDARLDTGRWLQVTGVLQQRRGLQWIDARDGSVSLGKPPIETTVVDEPVRVPAAPAPEVVFSTPTQDEIDVDVATTVRIQFSRDIDPATFKEQVRVRYRGKEADSSEPLAAASFTTQYQPAKRVLEVRPVQPLERLRTVQIELLGGIQGTDGQSIAPWTLTFMTGG
jgi:hypothetical protein